MSPRIGTARRWEARAIARILWAFGEETPWLPQPRTRAEIRAMAVRLIRAGQVRVARRHGRVLGFAIRDGAELHALYVARPARGRGIGKALLDAAKAAEPALGLFAHEANARARAFYAREGFTEAGGSDGSGNDEGLPDVRLVWERNAE